MWPILILIGTENGGVDIYGPCPDEQRRKGFEHESVFLITIKKCFNMDGNLLKLD